MKDDPVTMYRTNRKKFDDYVASITGAKAPQGEDSDDNSDDEKRKKEKKHKHKKKHHKHKEEEVIKI